MDQRHKCSKWNYEITKRKHWVNVKKYRLIVFQEGSKNMGNCQTGFVQNNTIWHKYRYQLSEEAAYKMGESNCRLSTQKRINICSYQINKLFPDKIQTIKFKKRQ